MSVPRGFLARLEEIQSRMPSVTSEEAYAQMKRAQKASEDAQPLGFNGPLAAPSRLREFDKDKP